MQITMLKIYTTQLPLGHKTWSKTELLIPSSIFSFSFLLKLFLIFFGVDTSVFLSFSLRTLFLLFLIADFVCFSVVSGEGFSDMLILLDSISWFWPDESTLGVDLLQSTWKKSSPWNVLPTGHKQKKLTLTVHIISRKSVSPLSSFQYNTMSICKGYAKNTKIWFYQRSW